ncbi:hypothetical protein CYMTET_38763 [Cymbomonas tetramitiformis]|uniref:FAD-binding FR-type domain-containing protein n=1 Tax=Cymbomonas tetramitiformis TaxID=36881 RepID=A0AAE0CDM1_9CHLO|nr:hypothetical protein CYMTET_38763 [Cymbomonas tetramitiformis]
MTAKTVADLVNELNTNPALFFSELSADREQMAIVLGTSLVALVFVPALLVYLFFSKRKPPTVLKAGEKITLPLIKKEELSHDTRLFRFGFPSAKHVLGLPIGQHIKLSFTDENGEEVERPYTPTSSDDELGYVDFVIKVYFAKVNPRFPDGGVMSQYMEGMKLGDTMDFRGPTGMIEYKAGAGNGEFHIRKAPIKASLKSFKEYFRSRATVLSESLLRAGGITHDAAQGRPPSVSRRQEHGPSQGMRCANKFDIRKFNKLGMIAGGTGITPMLQVMRAIKKDWLKDPTRKIEVSLLFANQSEDDILLREELDQEAKDCPWFKVWYTVDRATDGWKYSTGFINPDMVAEHLPAAGPDTQIIMCGPPPMIKFACKPAFEKVGITENMYITW